VYTHQTPTDTTTRRYSEICFGKDYHHASGRESFATPAGTLKPDLVIIDKETVLVVDVTVRYEDVGYLQAGYHDKMDKYSSLLPLLAERFKTNPGKALQIVVGSRGAIPKSTTTSLKELQIHDRKSYVSIALMALRSSIELYHAFLDYDALRA
jgi:hypothetical protein